MVIKIPYDKTTEDMESKIKEQAALGRRLVEVQNHIDGDFLVFTDEPLENSSSLKALEERITKMEALLGIKAETIDVKEE